MGKPGVVFRLTLPHPRPRSSPAAAEWAERGAGPYLAVPLHCHCHPPPPPPLPHLRLGPAFFAGAAGSAGAPGNQLCGLFGDCLTYSRIMYLFLVIILRILRSSTHTIPHSSHTNTSTNTNTSTLFSTRCDNNQIYFNLTFTASRHITRSSLLRSWIQVNYRYQLIAKLKCWKAQNVSQQLTNWC